ncbi:MAG: aldo/keto reductase [Parcubacteria group bacterium]|jgi:2,5-diketo-D-gluconate reductase B
MAIPKMKLNDGTEIPMLGLGSWNILGKTAEKQLKTALELGYRHFDTAEIYRNEEEVGKVIADYPREEIYIVSKVSPEHLSQEGVINACENSLLRLKTPYIDLYLIHFPREYVDWEKTLQAFKELRSQGKIKSFGVSNFLIPDLQKILPICKNLKLPLANNQIKIHPYLLPEKLIDYCKANGISITAYSPLAKGRVAHDKILMAIGEKYHKTASQIVLRWLFQKELIVIPKASSKEHQQENLEIFDFELLQEDVNEIDSLSEAGEEYVYR